MSQPLTATIFLVLVSERKNTISSFVCPREISEGSAGDRPAGGSLNLPFMVGGGYRVGLSSLGCVILDWSLHVSPLSGVNGPQGAVSLPPPSASVLSSSLWLHRPLAAHSALSRPSVASIAAHLFYSRPKRPSVNHSSQFGRKFWANVFFFYLSRAFLSPLRRRRSDIACGLRISVVVVLRLVHHFSDCEFLLSSMGHRS